MLTGNDLIIYNDMVSELAEARQLIKFLELKLEQSEDECETLRELLAKRAAGLMGD